MISDSSPRYTSELVTERVESINSHPTDRSSLLAKVAADYRQQYIQDSFRHSDRLSTDGQDIRRSKQLCARMSTMTGEKPIEYKNMVQDESIDSPHPHDILQ